MMKSIILFCFLLLNLVGFAQNNCPFYDKYMGIGDSILKRKDSIDFKAAINAYSTAMLHCPAKADSARKKILEVFKAIENLKNQAETALAEATKQTKIAQANALVSEAKTMVAVDPTLALRLTEQAMKTNNNHRDREVALKIYQENNFYKIIGRDIFKYETVAFSPDGKTILTGSKDLGKIILRDLKGNIKQEIQFDCSYNFDYAAFSPDGKTILIRGGTKICLLDLKGNIIQQFNIDLSTDGVFTSATFSPDGKTILTGSTINVARLWDLKGNILQEFITKKCRVYEHSSVAFSPDGKTIFTGYECEEPSRLWDLKGNIINEFKDQIKEVKSVAFSPDGKKILIGGSHNSKCILWDLIGDTLITKFKLQEDLYDVFVAFSPNGKTILTSGSQGSTVYLWDLEGNAIGELLGHTNSVVSIAFSPACPDDPFGGSKILTSSYDGTARLWDLKGNFIKDFKGHAEGINSVAFSPVSPDDSIGGTKILTGSYDGTIRLWDIKANIPMKEFKGDSGLVLSVGFSPTGSTILAVYLTVTGDFSYNKNICLWNLHGDTVLQKCKTHFMGLNQTGYNMGNSNAFSLTENTLLTHDFDSGYTVLLWDYKKDSLLQEIKGHTDIIKSIAFSRDGKTILACTDKTARLWTIEGKLLKEFKVDDDITSVTFSPDGKTILTGFRLGTTKLWNLQGKSIREFDFSGGLAEGNINSVAFSPDGKTILTGSERYVLLWDLMGSIPIHYYMYQSRQVNSIVFSPDGKKILAGAEDGTARMWNAVMSLDDFLKSEKIEPLTSEQKKQYGIK